MIIYKNMRDSATSIKFLLLRVSPQKALIVTRHANANLNVLTSDTVPPARSLPATADTWTTFACRLRGKITVFRLLLGLGLRLSSEKFKVRKSHRCPVLAT